MHCRIKPERVTLSARGRAGVFPRDLGDSAPMADSASGIYSAHHPPAANASRWVAQGRTIKKRIYIMELDSGRWMVWFLSEMTGGPLPPYLLEIVMRDGRSFYVHSGNSRDEETWSVIINVWDLRVIDPKTEAEIKNKLGEPQPWNEAKNRQPWDLHPALSIGRLRCKLDDISYVVEWWTRIWEIEKFFPEKVKKQIGFLSPTPMDK